MLCRLWIVTCFEQNGSFLGLKIMHYAQYSQWVQNSICQFIDKFFNFVEIEYLIHYVKFDMWLAFMYILHLFLISET